MHTLLVLLAVLLFAEIASAAQVFVCRHPDDSVTIVIPAQRSRRPGEADPAFLARILQRTRDANPKLRDLPCAQTDTASLPQERSKRYAWRMKAGKVAVDPAIPKPILTP